jgi:hypothetical protein
MLIGCGRNAQHEGRNQQCDRENCKPFDSHNLRLRVGSWQASQLLVPADCKQFTVRDWFFEPGKPALQTGFAL